MSEFYVVADPRSLAEVAAARVTALATRAVAQRGRFVWALAGGSTPKSTYELLAERQPHESPDWAKVEFFFGDERCVPPDQVESNYRMARETLLDHLDICSRRVHRIRGELAPPEAAASYEKELERTLGEEGRFDLVTLGLGADGHTASLFPGTSAVQENERQVVAVYVEKLDSWRVTLTLPVINRARHVLFLVSGPEKAQALARVRAGETLPAGMVRPEAGTLTWLADQEAAAASSPDLSWSTECEQKVGDEGHATGPQR